MRLFKSLFNPELSSETRYSVSFVASISVHLVLFLFLFMSLDTEYNPQKMAGQRGEIVQAVVVDNAKVEQEIHRIKTEQNREKENQEKQQKLLVQKAEQLKRESKKEEAKLEKMKQEMAAAKQEEEARLAEIKLAKIKEQKQLEALKTEKAKEQKKLAALDDQRQAEAERATEMRKQREKEEKIKTDTTKADAEGKRKAGEAGQQQTATEVQRVLGEWAEKIQQNKHIATSMPSDLYCKVGITVLPDGSVQVRLIQSSGNTVFDELSMKAVYKSQPFQLPDDPNVRDQVRSFDLGLRNDETMG